MFSSFYPNSSQALFDEAVGVATVEVLSADDPPVLKSYTYVAGTKTIGAGNSVIVVLRYEHNPGVVSTPLVTQTPVTGDRAIRKAKCMAAYADPAVEGHVRVVVAAEYPGLLATKNIEVLAFNRDLALQWTKEYSYSPISVGGLWQGDDVPVAMDIGPDLVAVVGTSQSPPSEGLGTDMVTLCYHHSDGQEAMPARRMATVNNDAAIDVEVTGFPSGSTNLVFALGQVTDNTTGLRSFATTVYTVSELSIPAVTYYSGVTGRDNVPVGIAYNGQVGSAMKIAIGGTTYPAPGQSGDADYFVHVFDVETPLPPSVTYLLNSRWLRHDGGGQGEDVMADIAMHSTIVQGDGSTSWVWATGKSDQGLNAKTILTYQYDDLALGGDPADPPYSTAKWNRQGNVSGYHDDEGLRITELVRAGRKDSIYVAGRTQNDSGNWDLVTLRYSQTAQNPKGLMWGNGLDPAAPIFAGSANGDDIPAGISAHHIFVLTPEPQERIFFGLGGRSFATSSDFDVLTTVYRDFHTNDE